MAKRLLGLAVLLLTNIVSPAGTVLEFDGKSWNPDPAKSRKLMREHETVCLVAPAETAMEHFSTVIPLVYGSPCKALKFQLTGQLTGVTLKRPGSAFHEMMAGADGVGDFRLVTLTTGPEASYLAVIGGDDGLGHHQARLAPDLEGVQQFLNVAAKGFENPEGESVPPLGVIARSNATFGTVVTVLQLLRQSGAAEAAIILNDELPDPYIVVEMDKRVAVPVVPKRGGDEGKKGRIVIEIDADGKVTAENGAALASDEEITGYLKARRKEVLDAGLIPQVHLRGARESLFRHSRRIIRRAAQADLTEVIFAAMVRETIRQKEHDLQMALPQADADGKLPQIPPMFIKVDAKGRIFINTGPAQEILDQDVTSREVPLLKQRLETYVAVAKGAGSDPLVQIYVEGDSKQQRVIDVLNALAGVGISKVTFTDLIDAE